MRLYFITQGLFEKSDSIGFDCVYQYELARDHFGKSADIQIFAEKFDPSRYPAAAIRPVADLFDHMADPDLILVYHFCDGWPDLEARLPHFAGKVIIRWHNNTPPWFFANYSRQSVRRTVAGFRAIQQLGEAGNCLFVCNSQFTRRQLHVLGVARGHLPVVYPASRYLDKRPARRNRARKTFAQQSAIHLLFVGRLVAHKGHRHIIMTARELQRMTDKPVSVIFPGRADGGARAYTQELQEIARSLDVDLRMPGEVDNEQLEALYADATVFVCMSEHEGFGLPVYEAMARDVPTIVWSNHRLCRNPRRPSAGLQQARLRRRRHYDHVLAV